MLASTNSGRSGIRTVTVTHTENSSPGISVGVYEPAASQSEPSGAYSTRTSVASTDWSSTASWAARSACS